MSRALIVSCVVVGGLMTQVDGAQQAPRFVSIAEVVSVPLSVTDGNRPVAGLTTADFELFDNGVLQTVNSTNIESTPIDVTLVTDTSGSVEGPALDLFKAAMQDIAVSLRPNDRVRLVGFGTTVSDITGLQPGGAPLPLERLKVGGATSFYNALAAVLMGLRSTERPQLVVAFSDGLDNLSFLDASTVVTLAGHANSTLYLLLEHKSTPARLGGVAPWTGQPDRRKLQEAAERTGGQVFEHKATDSLPALFDRVIDEFRTKYLLRYTPAGVNREGWHDISVRVKGKKFTVRARKGYEGG